MPVPTSQQGQAVLNLCWRKILVLGLTEPPSRLRATRYLPVLCTGYVVRELRRARQGFGSDPAMIDEPERFTRSRLPSDLVHIWGTYGHDQRLERGADRELLNRGRVLSNPTFR